MSDYTTMRLRKTDKAILDNLFKKGSAARNLEILLDILFSDPTTAAIVGTQISKRIEIMSETFNKSLREVEVANKMSERKTTDQLSSDEINEMLEQYQIVMVHPACWVEMGSLAVLKEIIKNGGEIPEHISREGYKRAEY